MSTINENALCQSICLVSKMIDLDKTKAFYFKKGMESETLKIGGKLSLKVNNPTFKNPESRFAFDIDIFADGKKYGNYNIVLNQKHNQNMLGDSNYTETVKLPDAYVDEINRWAESINLNREARVKYMEAMQ